MIRLEDGVPIYFAGDTCVFGDMQLIAHLYEPRLAVLPIGDHFTMGPARPRSRSSCSATRAACRATGARSRLLTGTPDALAALASARGRARSSPATRSSCEGAVVRRDGRRVPEIALEGELALDDALVLEHLDLEALSSAHAEGRRSSSARTTPTR